MQIFLFMIARLVQLLLLVVEAAMFLRAILSWFIMDEENGFMFFLTVITEPFILPFRVLLSRIRVLEEVPLDIPFFVAFIVLGILNSALPVISL